MLKFASPVVDDGLMRLVDGGRAGKRNLTDIEFAVSPSIATSPSLRYLEQMDPQVHVELGTRLRAILTSRKLKHSVFAKELGKNSSQLSRLLAGTEHWTRELASRIDELLTTNLTSVYDELTEEIDLYVASPITGLSAENIPNAHARTAGLVTFLRELGYTVSWPGEQITDVQKLIAPSVATTTNIRTLVRCRGLLYVQFDEVIHPSGALIELGIALGRKMKTTIVADARLGLPFMLRNGFDGVARDSPNLPDAKVHTFADIEDAKRQIANTGPLFFGIQ